MWEPRRISGARYQRVATYSVMMGISRIKFEHTILVFGGSHGTREAEVGHLDFAVRVDEEVGWL